MGQLFPVSRFSAFLVATRCEMRCAARCCMRHVNASSIMVQKFVP